MNTMCYRCMRNSGINGTCTICGAPIRTQRDIGDDYLLPLGTSLDEGKIVVGEKLGRGGFGITYVALDKSQFGVIALKEFVPSFMINSMRRNNAIYIDEQQWSQYRMHMGFFRGEAQTLAKLHHPNIVQVYFEFEENNTCYYGMELLKGKNLYEWARENPPLSAEDALQLIEPVLDALEYLHSKNVLHRDISPGNIFMRTDPGSFMSANPCLIDFGAAYDAQVAYSKSAPHIKSKGFSPPEQNAGRTYYGTYSDVYAITAVIYFLVTGATPSASEDRSLYGMPLKEPLQLAPNIPEGFSEAIMRGMDLDRDKRTQTISELRRNLREGLKIKVVRQELKVNDKQEDKKTPIKVFSRDSGHRKSDHGKSLNTDARKRSGDNRPLKGFLGSVLDTSLFALCWYAAMSVEFTREIVDDNLWIAGLGCLIIAIIVNLITCLAAGGTLGECIFGYPRGRMESDSAVLYALKETIYPIALIGKLGDLFSSPRTAINETASLRNGDESRIVMGAFQGPRLTPSNPEDRRIKQRVFEIKPSGQVLGRWANEKTTCDVPISDSMCVSRRHCLIAFDGKWYIEDTGSKNGTFVNGQRLSEGRHVALREGAKVSLGDEGIELVFHEN